MNKNILYAQLIIGCFFTLPNVAEVTLLIFHLEEAESGMEKTHSQHRGETNGLAHRHILVNSGGFTTTAASLACILILTVSCIKGVSSAVGLSGAESASRLL